MINPKRKIHSYNNPKNIEMKQELCPQFRACAGAIPLINNKKTIEEWDFISSINYFRCRYYMHHLLRSL